jgi:hypothetical protein
MNNRRLIDRGNEVQPRLLPPQVTPSRSTHYRLHFFIVAHRHRHVPSTGSTDPYRPYHQLGPQPSNITLGFLPSDPPLLPTSPDHKDISRHEVRTAAARPASCAVPGRALPHESHTRCLAPTVNTICNHPKHPI